MGHGAWPALLFGGWSQWLWLLAAFASISGAMAAPRAQYDFWTFRGETRVVTGEVLRVTLTDLRRGGRFSKSRWREVDYRFDVDGVVHEGTVFAGEDLGLGASESAPVEYVLDDPSLSRIVGSWTRPYAGIGVLILAGLLLTCLGFSVVRIRRALRERDLLRRGAPAEAEVQVTPAVLGSRVALVFEFEGVRYETPARWTAWRPRTLPRESRVFFDPRDPTDCVALELLPAKLRLSSLGTFVSRHGRHLIWGPVLGGTMGALFIAVLVMS